MSRQVNRSTRKRKVRKVSEMTLRGLGGKRVFDSKKLLKSAESIMDKFQSLSIRAAYSNASESDKDAKRAYAREAKKIMARLTRAAKKSDDPFLGKDGSYFDSWTKRLEKASQ